MTYLQRNKKRFNDNQIKSLEISFRADSKPESKTIQKMAVELGLEPRQVAIWFQNRRARSRTKQIERDYNMLKAGYADLASKVESLKRENQALNNQLQDMKTLLGKQQENVKLESGGCDGGEMKNRMRHRSEDLEKGVENEAEILDLAPSRDGSLASPVDWCSFDSGCYVDESSCSQWWEFWHDHRLNN